MVEATDAKITALFNPTRTKIRRLLLACKKAKKKADTQAARAAATPSPTPSPVGSAPWTGRDRGLGLEWMRLPVFSRKLADYLSFKEDWNHLVSGNLEPHVELVKVKENVSKADRVEIKNMRTMAGVWRYLDNEYGRDNKLAAERICHLHSFQVSKSAHNTTAKFKELHACWREQMYSH